MDKYTVDLDQVLNDFEYSELTDQHLKKVPEQQPFQPPPVTKHSINNVFHSLNEYLNSEVNTTLENNHLTDNKVADNSLTTTTVQEIKEDEASNSLEVPKPILPEVVHLPVVVTSDKVEEETEENTSYNNKFECDRNVNLKSDSTLNQDDTEDQTREEKALNCDNVNNSFDNNVISDFGNDQEEGILVDYLTNDEEVNTEQENLPGNADEAVKETIQSKVDEDEAHEDSETEAIRDTIQNMEGSLLIEPVKLITSPVLVETLENQSNITHTTTENITEESTNQEALETDVNYEETEAERFEKESHIPTEVSTEAQPCAVGFTSDLDIDENELNKMLEDLELEVKEEFESAKEDSDAEGQSELVKATEPTIAEPECAIEVSSDEKQGLVEEVVSEVQPEVDKEKVVTPNEPSNEENPKLEEVTVSRPTELPLNNKTDESTSRKIDLIGSPGSTPYNNVYINKSIEPKTAHEESDYASSASPTFSDCSTGSTGTASTASVEDLVNSKLNSKNEKEPKHAQEQVTNSTQEAGDGDAGAHSLEGGDNPRVSDSGDPPGVANPESSERASDKSWLGKQAPLWIPDADAASCLHCDVKFTVIKRRHHCRACGLVLCSKCCNLKFRLEYLDSEARVCNKCYDILNESTPNNAGADQSTDSSSSSAFRPNPNNPLEYCSTVSPLQQAGQAGAPPPTVMIPVGVLKRQGSNKKSNKSVMFCDGIAPGSDLTNLDQDFNYHPDSKKVNKSPTKKIEVENRTDVQEKTVSVTVPTAKIGRNQPKIDEETGCFIPKSETSLPPSITINKTDILYSECSNTLNVVETLKNGTLVFALTQNLFVHVKIVNMNCCVNKLAWCFSSEGLINVGSDEVVYLIEYIDEESFVPKDMFYHVHNLYLDAVKGTSIKELGLSLHNTFNFLDSRNHAGFVYIKPTFQCLENLIVPQEPFLIGILIHRWETPWAKLLPLRLILRLGAEYRYYPSPLISTRHRDSVFVEIGHTIINLLADFRNFTYTLPQIRGLIIHMEEKKTTITIPKNRYDLVMKSMNNSSEHILAFAGNFSREADSHLVCIQDTQTHDNGYSTHAINIHNKPRKVTGASFIVFNGSLKSSSGLTAKSNIVEDGLMIQIPPEHMEKIRENLRNMKDHTVACGCINAATDETVNIVWGDSDVDFNSGIKSPVDLMDMKGVPSIRVHNGQDYYCSSKARLIRWTEVFILQNVEDSPRNQDPVDISKVSESIAKACCAALVKYLDLLISNSCQKIGIRATLHIEKVSYSAGSNGSKLAPIYMRSLDNELIPVLHRITSNNLGDNAIILELVFRILNG